MAKANKIERKKIKYPLGSFVKSIIFIGIGIFSAGFGLESFLVPNGYIDGGITGISLLVKIFAEDVPLSLLIVIFNTPFIILGWRQVSKIFAIKSILAITGLALVIQFVHFPILTKDPLLIACFGGLFLGVGIGFAMRGGSVLDGTEVLAIFISRQSRISIGDIILIFNIIIFITGAYLLSIEVAMYAILTYFVASKAITYIIEGIEEYTGVTIISDESEKIREMLVHESAPKLHPALRKHQLDRVVVQHHQMAHTLSGSASTWCCSFHNHYRATLLTQRSRQRRADYPGADDGDVNCR